MSDSDDFPALARYLAALPDGVDSYPEFLAKASLCRTATDARSIHPSVMHSLPVPLRHLLLHPAPISSWIPEVHSHAIMLAVYDHCFSSREEFAEFAYQRQRALFGGRVYAVALRIVSPATLLKTAALRFGLFHRGIGFAVQHSHPTGATIAVDYPPGLYDDISRIGLSEGLRAALELCIRARVSVEIQGPTETNCRIVADW